VKLRLVMLLPAPPPPDATQRRPMTTLSPRAHLDLAQRPRAVISSDDEAHGDQTGTASENDNLLAFSDNNDDNEEQDSDEGISEKARGKKRAHEGGDSSWPKRSRR